MVASPSLPPTPAAKPPTASRFAVLGLVQHADVVHLGVLVSNAHRWVSVEEHWLAFDDNHRRRGVCPQLQEVWPDLLPTLSTCAFWTSPYGRRDRTLLGRLLLFADQAPLPVRFVEPVTTSSADLREALQQEAERQRELNQMRLAAVRRR